MVVMGDTCLLSCYYVINSLRLFVVVICMYVPLRATITTLHSRKE